MMSLGRDSVSVIVATLNCAATLQRCLDSVAAQTLTTRELIVVDGDSHDGTREMIGRNGEHIAHWRSEPDRGVYHAWNKALALASGEWFCFLGADDWFADSRALSWLLEPARHGVVNFVSGRGLLVNDRQEPLRTIGRPWNRDELRHYHGICHPGSMHHRSLVEGSTGFDERFRICADYDFNVRRASMTRAAFVDRIVVHVGDGGLCRRHRVRRIVETMRIQVRHHEVSLTRAAATAVTSLVIAGAGGFARRMGLGGVVRRVRGDSDWPY